MEADELLKKVEAEIERQGTKLLDSTAPFTKPAAEAKPKGKSKVEAEIERKNQGNKPKSLPKLSPMPRDARADNAKHDHPSRHGDRGEDDDESEHRPKRYLRKKAVAKRYGNVHERSIARMIEDGRLPPPDLYNGRFPLWDEATLDAHDREATLARREARCEHADAVANPK
jgi:hypothetical protein